MTPTRPAWPFGANREPRDSVFMDASAAWHAKNSAAQTAQLDAKRAAGAPVPEVQLTKRGTKPKTEFTRAKPGPQPVVVQADGTRVILPAGPTVLRTGPKRDNTGHPFCPPIANAADADKQRRIVGKRIA